MVFVFILLFVIIIAFKYDFHKSKDFCNNIGKTSKIGIKLACSMDILDPGNLVFEKKSSHNNVYKLDKIPKFVPNYINMRKIKFKNP